MHYNSLAEYTKRKLKAEYGEDFEIKTVYKDGYTAIAYPVNDPDLLFETYYSKKYDKGFNHYLQAIVEKQFKDLIEEEIKDFEYKYYVDVDVFRRELSGASTNITIEEHDALTKGTPQYSPTYWLFLSEDFLRLSNKELYELINNIAKMHDCYICIYFLKETDIDRVLKDYSKSPVLSSDMIHYLDITKGYESIGSSTKEDGQWKISFEEFEKKMKEVRSNELHG